MDARRAANCAPAAAERVAGPGSELERVGLFEAKAAMASEEMMSGNSSGAVLKATVNSSGARLVRPHNRRAGQS